MGGGGKMCPRWFLLGMCYNDFWNKASHIMGETIPPEMKEAYIAFLEKACW